MRNQSPDQPAPQHVCAPAGQSRRPRLHVLGLRGQPLHQFVARSRSHGGQVVQCGPRPLGVDVVGRQRRHTTPVVDTGTDQRHTFVLGNQIRWRLNAHSRAEHQPGDRDRRQVILDSGVGNRCHCGVFLGPEALHDHFLDVAKLFVQLTNRMQRVSPLGQRLTDADQQTGGKRYGKPTCVGQSAQPHRRVFVRAAIVREAFGFEQPPRRRLQHHAHRRRHRFEQRHLRPAHHPRIQVRQEPGLFEHPDRHGPHISQRGVIPALAQPLLRLWPTLLGTIPKGEQGLFAAELGPRRAISRISSGSRYIPAPWARSLPGTVTNVQ